MHEVVLFKPEDFSASLGFRVQGLLPSLKTFHSQSHLRNRLFEVCLVPGPSRPLDPGFAACLQRPTDEPRPPRPSAVHQVSSTTRAFVHVAGQQICNQRFQPNQCITPTSLQPHKGSFSKRFSGFMERKKTCSCITGNRDFHPMTPANETLGSTLSWIVSDALCFVFEQKWMFIVAVLSHAIGARATDALPVLGGFESCLFSCSHGDAVVVFQRRRQFSGFPRHVRDRAVGRVGALDVPRRHEDVLLPRRAALPV